MFADDFTPEQVEVTIKDQLYILQEATELAAVRFRNAASKVATFNSSGNVVGVNDPATIEPQLVADCLFFTDKNGAVKMQGEKQCNVTVAFVNALPARRVKAMFQWVKEHSDLGEETEVSVTGEIARLQAKLEKMRALKNESPSTEHTTGTLQSTE